jgi:hypothetical protein
MTDEKSTPLRDVRKGLGLLFRAAKTAAERLPKRGVEEAVLTSAREVGRAIENVALTIEREVFGKRGDTGKSSGSGGASGSDGTGPSGRKPDDPPDSAA